MAPLPRTLPLLLAILLLLAGCIPSGRKPQPGRPSGTARPTRPVEDPSARQVRQCLADLGKAGVRYSAVPDRAMGGGCTQLGTVRLLDLGLPVTNLGPMKCQLAERFAEWINEAVQKSAMAWLDARVARVESFGTYSCRPVNHREGARLSEHGRANAVDVAAFVLTDGRRITVKDGWNGSDPGARDFLRAVRKAACRRFAIVIGPEGDAMHRDHLHFDMGGNGPYCH
ncbi:MAG: extensin family protein [Sphingomonas bacterium]|jgi:hypothetical protein|nr:extensin family protein [Sphingomonas bacterium]MDB5719236.1 extensin family protein [Sphingomonas bacterium]